ncbi:hypothetical protein Pmani_018659 [Petrolisthes manimaculis]|uniref:Uncharacterized protein n=1 Tax=Petrolisthes manimaculis TaxID=1843537 RepID=A0AAE1PM29_9EUCA|nr:hypothetical protein Pmani_018659 [Petrolisthes manimaculis]
MKLVCFVLFLVAGVLLMTKESRANSSGNVRSISISELLAKNPSLRQELQAKIESGTVVTPSATPDTQKPEAEGRMRKVQRNRPPRIGGTPKVEGTPNVEETPKVEGTKTRTGGTQRQANAPQRQANARVFPSASRA